MRLFRNEYLRSAMQLGTGLTTGNSRIESQHCMTTSATLQPSHNGLSEECFVVNRGYQISAGTENHLQPHVDSRVIACLWSCSMGCVAVARSSRESGGSGWRGATEAQLREMERGWDEYKVPNSVTPPPSPFPARPAPPRPPGGMPLLACPTCPVLHLHLHVCLLNCSCRS